MSNNQDGFPQDIESPEPRNAGGLSTLDESYTRRGLGDVRPQVITLATGSEEKPNPFSPARVLSAVFHRFWFALPLGILLSAGAVGALWYTGEDSYRSFAWLRVRDKPEYIVFPSSENSRRFAATQVELLQSPVVIGRAVLKPEVRALPEIKEIEGKSNPVEWVKSRLKVRAVGRSEIYEVAVNTPSPETSATLCTAIVDSFMELQADLSDSHFRRMKELLAEQLKTRQREYELKAEKVRELTREEAGQTKGIVEGENGASTRVQMAVLGVLHQRQVDAEVKAEILKANITAFRESMKRTIEVPERQLEDLVERDPLLLSWKQELVNLQENLKVLSAGHSPVRKSLEGRIGELEEKIRVRTEDLGPQLKELAHKELEGRRQVELEQLEHDLSREMQLIQYFRDKIVEEQVQHQDQRDLSLDLELARADMSLSHAIQEKISLRIAAMDTEAQAPSQVELLQAAELPKFPEGTTLPKKMMALGIAAFFFPFAAFAGYELMIRRIYDPSQLRQETNLDYVGEVATLPVRSRLRSQRAFDRQAFILEESVDSVRTALAVCDRREQQKVVVVCSAVSGEGKTHLSAQLALSWSRGHVGPVLLIDADMRSPGIHEMFDVNLGPGLVEVLRGTATLQEAIVTDWGEGVHILPAGKLGAFHPDRLISSQRFIRLLEVAREHYSRIIIDVPPILSAHETLLLAKMADGALMCTLRDYSRSKQVQEAHQRLTRAGVNVLGAVLNGTPTKSYVYHYGSYY